MPRQIVFLQVTLTGFVKWMGRTGRCIVDETEKGWFITYIDRDPESIAAQERKNKKIKMDKDDEEKLQAFIKKQVTLDKDKAATSSIEPNYTELLRNDEDEKVTIQLEKKPQFKAPLPLTLAFNKPKLDDDVSSVLSYKSVRRERDTRPKSALDEIMAKEEALKEKNNRKDHWLTEDVVVKIVTKSLGDEYYKQKGVVVEVRDKYAAVVKLFTGKKVKLDQAHLETVIPALGKRMKVVNGAYRGEIAKLLAIDEDNFCVFMEITSGLLQGRKVNNVQYEDICKLHADS